MRLSFLIAFAASALFFSSCTKDNDVIPQAPNGQGLSKATFDFDGNTYEIEGIGDFSFNEADEDNEYPWEFHPLFNNILALSIVEFHDNTFENGEAFILALSNYYSPGTYSLIDRNSSTDDMILGSVGYGYEKRGEEEFGIYSSSLGEASESEVPDGSITITKDNDHVIEGTFEVEAVGEFEDTEVVNKMSGSFSIRK